MPTPLEIVSRLIVENDGANVDSILYRQLIRSLIYLITVKPDISYVVRIVSRFIIIPK